MHYDSENQQVDERPSSWAFNEEAKMALLLFEDDGLIGFARGEFQKCSQESR